jgi:hypothetical protein
MEAGEGAAIPLMCPGGSRGRGRKGGGRAWHLVLDGGIGLVLQQHLHAFLVPFLCRIVEGRATVLGCAGGGEEGEGEDARAHRGARAKSCQGLREGLGEGGAGGCRGRAYGGWGAV